MVDLPAQAFGVSPHDRLEINEDISSKPALSYDILEPVNYDITLSSYLTILQVQYKETFADEYFPSAEAFAHLKCLKQEMALKYGQMVGTAVETFHGRTRCPTCKQTPITTDYFEMNHSLPKGAWIQWKKLGKKMAEQRPEILDQQDWLEFLGEMKTIEMWYWEDNTASVECGRVSWNGNFAPQPLPTPDDKEYSSVLSFPQPCSPYYVKVVAPYTKAIARFGKAL